MPTQTEKYHLAMSGEYFVAAQLQRLGVSASVTYGNAKSADVVAFTGGSDRVVVVEVKTTRQPQWVVGGRVPSNKSEKPWVFVYLPENSEESPKFFVLTQSQLHDILAPLEAAYFERYEERHGKKYGDKPGVVNVSRRSLSAYENKWEAIVVQLQT